MDEAMRYENGLRIGRAWVDSARAAKTADVAPREEAVSPSAVEAFDAVPEAADATAALQDTATAGTLGTTYPGVAHKPAMGPDPLQGPPEVGTPHASPLVSEGNGPLLPPMRGITVGTLAASPVGPQTAVMQRSIGRQATAAAMFVAALAPPIIVALLLGLSHRAFAIPSSAVWAWMAAVIALGVTLRSSVVAFGRGAGAWLEPVLLGVLLLVPAGIALYLRLTLDPVSTRLAVTQVALYAVALVTLLMSSLRETAG